MSASAVGQWENGITTPRRETVFALEDLFECPGELATLLGYGRPVTNGTRRAPAKAARSEDRLENLEVRLDRLEAKVDQLLDRYPPAEGSR